MQKRWLIGLIALLTMLLAATLLLPAAPVQAQEGPGDGGSVIWNEDYTLGEGQQLSDDLVVFNGDVTLESDSRVEGSVVVWNGSAEVNGVVEKDLVVSSGDIHLGEDAWVRGDVVCSWDCNLEQAEGTRVDGGIIKSIPLPGFRFDQWHGFSWIPSLPSPLTFWSAGPGAILGWILRVIRSTIAVLVIAAVAGLVALIWPQQIAQVGKAAIEAPGPSFGVGLLTVVAAVALVIALAITICLSPAAALLALALGAAGLFGWACIGALVGERLLRAFKAREVTPLWAAALGTLVITLISGGLSIAFCLAPLGWLITFITGCLGLGAVVLTRFGTLPYAPAASSGQSRQDPTPP